MNKVMKKVLLYLLIIVFSASFIGIIFQLSREDETISASTETGFLNKGEVAEIDYNVANKKKSTKVSFKSSNNDIIEINEGAVKAVGKGNAVLTITIQNARKKTQMIQRKIYVGDGSSSEYPLYIRNENDLLNIRNIDTFDKFFEQTNDIVITKNFETIDEFRGVYNGKGHKIINYQASGEKQTSAMFNNLYDEALFSFVVFENVQINGAFEAASVVANINYGLIDYVEVSGSITNTSDATNTYVAAIASKNIGGNASIQRCVNKAKLTTAGLYIGGIAGENEGTITCCQNGDNDIASTLDFNFYYTRADLSAAVSGGIVAINKGYDDSAVIIANNYSINDVKVLESANTTGANFGGVIGVDVGASNSFAEVTSKNAINIFGNYYLINAETLIARGIGNVTNSSLPEGDNLYVTNGLPIDIFQSQASIFVSYITRFEASGTTSKQSWPTDIWVLDSSVFPRLVEMSKFGYKPRYLSIQFPVLSVGVSQEIDSASKFFNALETGVFTDPSNAGKTFYITRDIDFAETGFKLVGTKGKPIVVNLVGRKQDGSNVVLSNINVTSSTDIETTVIDGETIDSISRLKDIGGLFGYSQNATFENLTLDNCTVNTSGMNETVNVGGIIGTMNGGAIKNCRFNGDDSSISVSCAKVATVGGIAGNVAVAKILNSHVKTKIETSYVSSNCYIGGVAGKLGNGGQLISGSIDEANVQHTAFTNCYAQNTSFNGTISALNGGIVGGAVGFVQSDAVVDTFKSNGSAINALKAGGIAGLVNGVVELGATKVTMSAINAGGFVYKIAGENSRLFNSYCETRFTNKLAENNSGIACEISDNSRIAQCVNVNDFVNDASASKNYARSATNAKFEFIHNNNAIADLNIFSNANKNSPSLLINCFYVNKVNGVDSKDTNKVRFFSQTGEEKGWFLNIGTADFVDEKIVMNKSYNGTLRNGRLLTNGKLASGPSDLTATWKSMLFTNSLWQNTNTELDVSGSPIHMKFV